MLAKMTNARKISVKMKTQWSKELEETGFLACPISGCSQRYVSMANFTTHYKWCSGEKNFGVCPYCESVIFSDRKSTLHHMEVEHPDKIDEYKANYMIVEIEEQEEACAGTSSEVTCFEDESSDMYVEEVSSKCQKAGRKPKDKRFYSKENHLSPSRKFFRNKMKNINETVSENIKEFQKCVRFDSIVSKINSVSDSSRTSELFQEATVVKPPKKQGERKPRYILTGNMGEEPSYFDDDLQTTSDTTVVPDDPATVKLTTKSKLVLDLQRYKRYNEYLKWTRDWGSERKTYSRSKPSERSHNSTVTTCLSSDSFEIQDIHQLMETPEKWHISLNEEEIPQTIDEQDLRGSPDPVVTAKEVSIFQQNLGVDMDGDIVAGNIRTPLMKENHSEISLLTEPVRDEFSLALNRAQYESQIEEPPLPVRRKIFSTSHWAGQKKTIKVSPCAVLKKPFKETPRSGQNTMVKESPKLVQNTTIEETPRVVQNTTIEETPRSVQNTTVEEILKSVQKKTPRPTIKQPIITFGKQIITPPDKPPVTLNLEHFMKKGKRPCLKMKDSNESRDLLPQDSTEPPTQSDEIILPTLSPSMLFPKRKRGRPSKMEQQQRQELFKMIFKQEDGNIVENTASADSSSSRPLRRSVRERMSKIREMRRLKGRPKFKSLMGPRNKFRGLNRIVFNARKVSQESMMRRQVMAYRKIRLSNALTQTDSSEAIDDIQKSSENKSDHNYSTCRVEINAQSEIDKVNEGTSSEKEPESLKTLEAPAFEVEVSTSFIQGTDVSTEMVQDEVAKTPDLNVTSEVIVASEKESNQEEVDSSHALTSTPIASFGPQTFASSSASDIENCSVISQVIADFETVTPKQKKEKTSSNQLSLSSSVSISESTSVSTAAPTAVSSTVSTAVTSTVPTTITSAVPTAVTSTIPTAVTSTTPTVVSSTVLTAVSSTVPTAVSSTVPTAVSTVPTAVSSTVPTDVSSPTAVSSTASTTVLSTVPTAVSTTVTATGSTTATSNTKTTLVPVTVPGTSAVSLTKATTVASSKASTYVPTIVSINVPSAVQPSTPTKTSPNVSSIKLVSGTPDNPVQKSFKLNKKLIYHPENQGSGNSREPILPPRETEKPVVERPITFDELRRSIMESSKVPTSLMAVDSVAACTEVVTQDPKKQAPASFPDIRHDGIKVKRPRGRPKKEKDTSLQEPVQTPPQVKRRGRPRKIRVEESTEKTIPNQTEGKNSDNVSVTTVDSSTSAAVNKPQEEEVSMEVDVASEILRIQGEIPDSDSMRVGVDLETTVGDKSIAVSPEPVLNKEIDAEKDASGDISDKALQNKIPENLEKGTSEVKDSNQPEILALPVAEEQPESTDKPSDTDKTVTSIPQVIKLVSPENGSAIAEESQEDSINEMVTDDSPKPRGRRGRKPKRGRKRKSDSMLTPDLSATPVLTPDQSGQPKRRGRGRPKKVVPTEDLSQSIEDRSNADTSLVVDGKTAEDTTPVAVRESSADTAVVGVRKSRRSITKKVVTDYSVLEETEIKAKLVEHVPQPTPVKKGNRGRPRKYPLKEPESSAPTTKEPVITRLESAEGVQKRGSRKGRPTKCVDYADLNSGNLDEVDKILEDLEKSGKANNEVFQGEPEPAHPEKVHDDTFILPPKKRKRVSDAKMFKNAEPLVPEAVLEVPLQEPPTNLTDTTVSEPQSAMVPVEVTEAVEVTPQVYTELFTEYLPAKSMYKLLTNSEYEEYLPPIKQSICFKVKDFAAESDWVSLGQFTSLPIGESNHYTFFTGGPVSSSAFCPTWEETQYIALCTCTSMLEDNFYDSVSEEKGLIQIWNLGPLPDSGLVRAPTMDLGISHNYGKVLDMTWCPTGAWQDSTKTSESLPRLGLLAAAFTDSCIRIYSVPHPNFLEREDNKAPLYFASPCITLEPLCEGPCLATSKSTCTIVTWQRSNGCEKIAGGYGNGTVCLWLVHSSATICSRSEEERVYFPFKVFQAHGTPITGLSFSPLNDRWVVTCSYDKTLRFFDLLDPSVPFSTVKRGFSRKAHWANNFCGALVCLHDDVVFKGCSFFKECGTENLGTNNMSTPNTLICESAISAVKDYYALADVDGSLIVSVLKNLHYEHAKSTCYRAVKIFQTEIVPCDKSSVQPLLIENEVTSECPDEASQSDPLGGFINSLDSDESDEASLSNSILLVQLLDMLREQSCELELSVKEKLKALCEPLQDLIDNLEDLDENSYIKFCILDKSFALNREMFDRILVTDAPMDVSLDLREDDIVATQSEPTSKEMDTETTSNSESNIEKQSTDSPLSNEPTREAQQPGTAEESSKEVRAGGDSNNTVSESLDKSSAKEKESNISGDLGSEVEIESNPVQKESECLSQSSVPDSKEVEVDSDLVSKEAEIVSQSGASDVKEGTVSSPLISNVKETDSSVVESKETKSSETHGDVSDSSVETTSHPCVLISQEKESDSPSEKEENKTESSVVSDTIAINSALVTSESDSPKDESVLLQPSEMGTEDVSASTEKPVALSSDASESIEIKTVSLITDDPCIKGDETVSSMLVEKDPESLCQGSLSIDSTVISISETSIDSNVQNSRNEILEKATETLMVVDSVSEEVCVDGQSPDESGVMPCENKSDTLEDAQTNLLPCDSTTENTSNVSGEELLTETAVSSQAKDDETMEVDMIPDRELEKQDDVESIFSETLEVDSSDFLDSDSDDSLLSECSMETESADSSEPTSPIMFAEDSMDAARNLMPDPTDKEVRSESASVPTSNNAKEDVTSQSVEEKSVASLKEIPAKESKEITLETATESNTDQGKASPKSTTTGDNDSDSIPPPQSTSTVDETNKADVEAPEEIILSSSLDIQSVDSSSKLCESEDMEVDPSPQEIVKGSEDREDVHVELGTESPAIICKTNQNTAAISENIEGVVSISGKTDTTDLVSKSTENNQSISEDSVRVSESPTNCEIICEETETSDMVSESNENGRNIAENTEATDMVSENMKSIAENIKNEVIVPETPENCEGIAENTETIDVINDSSNILYAQPRRPPTKRAFLQGIRWAQAESLFNSSRDVKREEYFPNYKRVKPVKEQYEDFASNNGLIFRDIFLNDPNDLNKGKSIELTDREIHVNSYGVSSINTVSWNPNQGSKYWIFSAGNSGLARLSCLSSIASLEQSTKRKR